MNHKYSNDLNKCHKIIFILIKTDKITKTTKTKKFNQNKKQLNIIDKKKLDDEKQEIDTQYIYFKRNLENSNIRDDTQKDVLEKYIKTNEFDIFQKTFLQILNTYHDLDHNNKIDYYCYPRIIDCVNNIIISSNRINRITSNDKIIELMPNIDYHLLWKIINATTINETNFNKIKTRYE